MIRKTLSFAIAVMLASQASAQYTPVTHVVTKTLVAANTSTPICTSQQALKTTIQVQTGNVGIGIRGQTLTGATYGTTSTDPDIILPSADQLYTDVWGMRAAVTAYTATQQIVICVQTVRYAG